MKLKVLLVAFACCFLFPFSVQAQSGASATATNSSKRILATFRVNGQLQGIAVDPSGDILAFAVDRKSIDVPWTTSITRFSPSGAILGTFSVSIYSRVFAVDGSGNIWAGDGYSVYKLSPSGSVLDTFKVDNMYIAADRTGNVWVTNPNSQSVTELSSSGDILGTFNIGDTAFNISTDASGNLWVSGVGGITEFSMAGKKIGSIYLPFGSAAVDERGNVWTTASWGVVTEFNPSLSQLGAFKTGYKSNFQDRMGIVVDKQGNVWVTDDQSQSVTELSSSGTILGTFPVGKLPNAIVIDRSGNLWVANAGDNTVTEIAGEEATKAISTEKIKSPWVRFKALVAELKKSPDNQQAREELLKTYAVLKPKPAVPQVAKAHYLSGYAKMKALQGMAQKPSDYMDAANEFSQAVDAAPWWPDAYYNYAVALENAEQFDQATAEVNDYLLAKPDAEDGATLLAEIQEKQKLTAEQAQQEAQEAAQKQAQQQAEAVAQQKADLASKYVFGGASRIQLGYFSSSGINGTEELYSYTIPDDPYFYPNLFKSANGEILAIMLRAESINGAYTDDKIEVYDITNINGAASVSGYWTQIGQYSSLFNGSFSISFQPDGADQIVSVTETGSGSGIRFPLSDLYKWRAEYFNAKALYLTIGGEGYRDLDQTGCPSGILMFKSSVLSSATDPNVDPKTILPTYLPLPWSCGGPTTPSGPLGNSSYYWHYDQQNGWSFNTTP